jgi:hypothetical protein
MKECFKCKTEKPLTMFYKHRKMADGRVNKCKECNKKDVRDNRKDKIEYYRDYDISRGSRQGYEYCKEYRLRYPNKYNAHSKVNRAVRAGNLFSEPCELCGSEETHAHHDDYSKPLNVRWLCPPHHKEWHDLNGEGANG